MKIGCSLPFDIFGDEMSETSLKICTAFGSKENLFSTLAKEVDSIELRAVKGKVMPERVFSAAKLCADYGMEITIHGDIRGVASAGDFFFPYTMLFESGLQPFYNITVHTLPTKEESESLLKDICTLAEKENYPVRITLENERLKNEHSVNGICISVEEIVNRINSPILYSCFDFGHQLSNIRKFGEEEDVVTGDFLFMTRHTHIHSLVNGTTHYPITEGETLLDKNLIGLMSRGYDEVLNLELEAQRFDDKYDIKDSFVNSISVLKAAYYQAKVKLCNIPEFTTNYKNNLLKVKTAFEKSSFGIGLVGPAAYVMKLGDKKIAVDVSMRKLPGSEESTALLSEYLSGFDAVIVTHNHYDHCDLELLQSLPKDVLCLIPDFIPNELENKVETHPGLKFSIGDAEIEFFDSLHSRATNNVPEYGFAITYKGGTYVFPGDVRTYDWDKYPKFSNVKVLFAHLWLFNPLNTYDNPYIEQFTDFIRSFGAEKVCMAHFNDVRRPVDQMWSDMHYNAVKGNIDNSTMLTLGSWIEL